uniref:CCHC-type domain-containing protein n=1 Tax=Acanthochromis polyacanthus TaxID=80966 RepID=A0A3Q1GBC7_9TELE
APRHRLFHHWSPVSAISPTTPPKILQAVASQGALLGQHSQTLRDLTNLNQEISTQLNTLTDQINSVAITVNSSPPIAREPYVPTPERYRGDQGTCRAFLMQASLVFELRPLTYSTDKSAVWAAQNPICNSYLEFVKEMKRVFDHPLGRAHLSEEEKAQRRRRNACLYCGEVGHYTADCPAKPDYW